MLIINVLCLMAICFALGYYLGKGKIEIVKPVKMDAETKERIEKQMAEQAHAIEQYNNMVREMAEFR